MLTPFIAVALIFVLLVVSEYWWRRNAVHSEFGRKFIHITVGSFVAFWPYFMSWRQIEVLSIAFLAVVLVSKWFKIFQAIHSVQRPTWGEIYFAIVVGMLALVSQEKAIYTVALLQMSLADGLAAIIGTLYGHSSAYTVMGHRKSVLGTLTFFGISAAILLGYQLVHGGLAFPMLVALTAMATLVENVAVAGLDNLLVPLLVAVVLHAVS